MQKPFTSLERRESRESSSCFVVSTVLFLTTLLLLKIIASELEI